MINLSFETGKEIVHVDFCRELADKTDEGNKC